MKKKPWILKIFGIGVGSKATVPFKKFLITALSGASKLFEPYDKLKNVPEVDNTELDSKAAEFEERLYSEFQFDGTILCEIRGDKPDGTNHYVSDWCLWNGVFLAMLSHKYQVTNNQEDYNRLEFYLTQYVDNWIDDKGYIRRGWLWTEEGREYEYRISLDQISGMLYGLSQCPQELLLHLCLDKILLLVDRMIEDKYEFKNPDGSWHYDTNCRPNMLSLGINYAIPMGFLWLAYTLTNDEKYRSKYEHFNHSGASGMLRQPLPKFFEKISGFNFNISLLSLTALNTLNPTLDTKKGLKWLYGLIRRSYNPFWRMLTSLYTGDTREMEENLYMLNTINLRNGLDYEVGKLFDNIVGTQSIKTKSYFGDNYYNLPPKLMYKRGDAFILQSVWRKTRYYGQKKGELRSNRKYTLLPYLATYWLYRLISK